MVRIRSLWPRRIEKQKVATRAADEASGTHVGPVQPIDLDIAPHDPLLAYLQTAHGPLDVGTLRLESPALDRLRAEGVVLLVPLFSQGELVGLVNLGPRLSEQEYSSDDRRLLQDLAARAAPALRVAQLVRQQQAEAQVRERIEQELRVARVVQQTLLPKELPDMPAWNVAANWQPARAVSGDFYDFIALPEGKLGIVVADVTDKGVPAALVMATTRSMIRAAAERCTAPGELLSEVNDRLCPEMPPMMFVTCLYIVLDPATGRIEFANAGHNLPFKRTTAGGDELEATGMPLGLLCGMDYDSQEATIGPGESIVLYSDGLVEAHNPHGEMFGFPRLRGILAERGDGDTIATLSRALAEFTGPAWEQEDDVTVVVVERESTHRTAGPGTDPTGGWVTLADLTISSTSRQERIAQEQVAEAVAPLGLPPDRLEQLKTAVAEATLNAIEHGNQSQPDLPVGICVRANEEVLVVSITDCGCGPSVEPEVPDLEAKLAGMQSPRGWGLLLIRSMVDEVLTRSDDSYHTVELVMKLGGNHDTTPRL